MKGIGCWDDLRTFGIVPRETDACSLSFRVRCDVTERGKAAIEKLLDCNLCMPVANDNEMGKCVGTLLLPTQMLVPLGIIALLESGCTEVWLVWETLIGVEPSDSAEAINSAHIL